MTEKLRVLGTLSDNAGSVISSNCVETHNCNSSFQSPGLLCPLLASAAPITHVVHNIKPGKKQPYT